MTITKLIYHPIAIFTITVVGIVFFISLDKSAKKTEISTENIRKLESELHQISDEVVDLEENIMETDSEEYKEKIIRNELLLQKPGEKVIQLPNLENQESLEKNDVKKNSPIDQWKKLFK